MLPVRCFTCNHVLGHLWDDYVKMKQTHTGKECLDNLKLRRICCRRMVLTHVNVIDDLIQFPNKNEVLDECNTVFKSRATHAREVPCD